MLVVVWLSSLMMMRSSDAASAKIITARSGEAILLSSDLQETELGAVQDFRWTHPNLVVSTKNDNTCHHKHCELLKNGSLKLNQVQPSDSGNYSLQMFNKAGTKLQNTKVFLLRVEADGSSSSSSSVVVPVLICLLLLLLPIIFFIITRRMRMRRSQTTTPTGHLEENVYVVMQGNRGNKTKDAEKQEKVEESHYVDCNRVVSMKTPVTQQTSADEEDIYV